MNAAKGNFDGPRQDYQIDANDQLVTQRRLQERRGRVSQRRAGDADRRREDRGWRREQQPGGVDEPNAGSHPEHAAAAGRQHHQRGQEHQGSSCRSCEANLPAGIEVTQLTDLTDAIQASVDDVEFELVLTVVLVVMVIFLFLRSLHATIIPSVAVPLSLVGTLAAMYLLGYSLDNLSLMALTISTGFVVDDAIVMIENISRYLEAGDPPMEAALKGAEQIGFTILSLTVSLIAVLIPLLFMGDVVGRLFREFAVTLAVTIVISAVVSLTLTPMMASRILHHNPEEQQGRVSISASERVFESMIAFYGRTLKFVLRYQTITLLVALGTLVLTIFLYIIIPKGFFPGAGHRRDPGHFAGAADHLVRGHGAEAAGSCEGDSGRIPRSRACPRSSEPMAPTPRSTADGFSINLKPLDERDLSASDVIRRLQAQAAKVQGIQLFMQPVQNITVDDRVSRTQYQYTLEDPDPNELNCGPTASWQQLKKLPESRMLRPTSRPGGLAVSLVIDRVTASRLGIAPTTSTTRYTTLSASGRSTRCIRS